MTNTFNRISYITDGVWKAEDTVENREYCNKKGIIYSTETFISAAGTRYNGLVVEDKNWKF